MSITSFLITKFSDKSTISALSFNKPLNLILALINRLRDVSKLLNNRSAIIQVAGFFDSSVSLGDLVYYDTKLLKFKPALAQLAAIPGYNGQSVLALTCRVLGLVIAKDNQGIKILRQGYYLDPIIAATLMSSTARPGLYYLSPDNPGKAVLDPVWHMRQPCISYYGDNKFSVMTNYIAHDSHHHATFVIQPNSAGWVDKLFSIPLGANLGYMSKEVTAIFVNGVLNTDFDITNTTIKYTGSKLAILLCLVVIFNYFPFAYGAGLVRAISSESKQLTVDNSNGYVKLAFTKPVLTSTIYSSKAISQITDDNLIITTPVISGLRAGLNVDITQDSRGICSIGFNSLMNTRLIASDITCRGAKYVVDNLLSYVVFPKSASLTTAIANIPINNKANADYTVKFWGLFRGTGGHLTIRYYWMSLYGTTVLIPTQFIADATITINLASGKLVTALDPTGIKLKKHSMPGTLLILMIHLGAALPVELFKCGCSLSLYEDQSTDIISLLDVRNAPITDYGDYFNEDTVLGAINQLGHSLGDVTDVMANIVGL